MLLLAIAASGGIATAWGAGSIASWGPMRGVVLLIAGVVGLYASAVLLFRAGLRAFPLEPGDIPVASREEFIYHVYQLSFLILFYPVMRSGAVPVPLMRPFYLALGARLGANTYSSGIIFDPGFVSIGRNSIVGQHALLVPHVNEGDRLAHFPIVVGDNVTIGAHAVIMSDVTIGNRAVIAAGAIVVKGTRIGAAEIWGGVPARRIGAVAKAAA